MTAPRLCACGCKADLDALGKRRQARCASGACRARASRAKHQPQESAQKAHRAARGGLQVSYRKAVEKLTEELRAHELVNPPSSARIVAEVWLRDLLSDAQRRRLEEQSQPLLGGGPRLSRWPDAKGLNGDNQVLRAELWNQWEYNHAEHCGHDWPHDGRCGWPLPDALSGGSNQVGSQ